MTDISFRFNESKALETILYLSNRLSSCNVYSICQLLYYADKTSLEKYGRFIFGESYAAMKEGATPSNAYNLLKEVADNPTEDISIENNYITAHRDAKLDLLSESDRECLDQIITIYNPLPSWKRGGDAHDLAWRKAWDSRGTKRSAKMTLRSIADTLSDSEDIIDYVANRSTD